MAYLFYFGIAVIIAIIVSVISISVMRRLHKNWQQRDGKVTAKNKDRICKWGTVAIIIFLTYVFWGPLALPSTVNVTPLSQLKGVDVSDIDAVSKKLIDAKRDLGNNFSEWDSPICVKDYSYYHMVARSNINVTGGSVSIFIHEDAEDAKEQFADWGRMHSDGYPYFIPVPYMPMKYSEDIEARLYWSTVERSIEMFWFPYSRWVTTLIRVDNIVISIDESSNTADLLGKSSTEAIAKLCKVLSE